MKRASNKSNISIVKDYLAGVRPFVQVGYTPTPEPTRKDGEEWTDRNGTSWIQVGSSKISKNLYEIKENSKRQCSSCNKDIAWFGDKNDTLFFNKTGKCYDCVVEEETKMRLDGTYDTYEKIKIIKNQQSFLEHFKIQLEESLEYLRVKSNKIEYFNDDGSTDCWTDVSRETFIEDAEKDMEEVIKSLILCKGSLLVLEQTFTNIQEKAALKERPTTDIDE